MQASKSTWLATSLIVGIAGIVPAAQAASTGAAAPAAVTSAASSPSSTSSPSSAVAAPVNSAPAAPPSGSAPAASGSPSATNTTRIETPPNLAPFAPGGSFTTDNGNPELGTSPGQTSSGTAVGNTPSGLDAAPGGLDSGNTSVPVIDTGSGVISSGILLPGDLEGGYAGSAGPATAAAALGNGVQVSSGTAATVRTPLLDQVTRSETARAMRQRERGTTPRVIGIAPRTDNDRTDQMPDDPVIRY